VPSLPELLGANTTIGGLAEKTLKKENGAKLGLPALSIVLAKHMGLGPIAPSKYWCNLGIGISDGLTVSIDMTWQR
jgi:hypothetical protein